MRVGSLVLGVDVGSAATKAVLATPDGGRLPLIFDGELRMPSGVFVDPGGALLVGRIGELAGTDRPGCYVADPAAHLAAGEVDVAGRTVSVVDLFAAVMAAVRAEATRVAGQPPPSVALPVPPQWGPRRRGVIEEAARRVGFAEVVTVSAPAAVTAYLAASTRQPPVAGSCVLVVDAGAAGVRLTVLQQTAGGLVQLATTSVAAVGRSVDDVLATRLLDAAAPQAAPHVPGDGRDPRWVAVVAAARGAKESLAGVDRTAVALPGDYPVVALSRAELAVVVEPAMDRLAVQVADVLAAADVDRSHLAAVVLTGGAAWLPGLTDALQVTTGRSPLVPDRGDLATADGALFVAGIREQGDPREPLPTVRPRLSDVVRPFLLVAASGILFASVIVTVWTTGGGRLAVDVHLAVEVISAAAVVGMLAAWSSAHLVPSIHLAGESSGSASAGRLARQSFLAVAGFGLGLAAIYGMAAGGVFGFSGAPYLGHALYAALPVAAAMVVVGALAPAIPPGRQPSWLAEIRLPVVPVLVGAAGILLMRYAVSQPPNFVPGGPDFMARVGAAVTGVAIALTVARTPLLRLAGGALLAVGGLVVGHWANTPLVVLGYVLAAVWWAALAAVRTSRAAYPTVRQWLLERGR